MGRQRASGGPQGEGWKLSYLIFVEVPNPLDDAIGEAALQTGVAVLLHLQESPEEVHQVFVINLRPRNISGASGSLPSCPRPKRCQEAKTGHGEAREHHSPPAGRSPGLTFLSHFSKTSRIKPCHSSVHPAQTSSVVSSCCQSCRAKAVSWTLRNPRDLPRVVVPRWSRHSPRRSSGRFSRQWVPCERSSQATA